MSGRKESRAHIVVVHAGRTGESTNFFFRPSVSASLGFFLYVELLCNYTVGNLRLI